jgi:hypothetical protein
MTEIFSLCCIPHILGFLTYCYNATSPHSDLRSSEKACAAAKLRSEISLNIAKIAALCAEDLALAPAFLNGKRKRMPARCVLFRAASVCCRIS